MEIFFIAENCIPMISSCCCCCRCAPVQEAEEECCRSCLCLEKNWASLEEECSFLTTQVNDLLKKADLEERGNKVPAKEVELWLKTSRELVGTKLIQLQKDYNTMGRCQWRRISLGWKVSKKLEEAKRLLAQRGNFKFEFHPQTPSPVELIQVPESTFGMERELSLLRAYFNDDKKRVIGIHGLGGIGKTTLLSVFNNELERRAGYDVVIYIKVSNSQVLNVAGMQQMIAHRLCLTWNNEETEDVRAQRLLQELRKKKFVIFLDDVWEKFELQDVGIPDPCKRGCQDPSGAHRGSKLIIASRNKDVCVHMKAHKDSIEMEYLKPEFAWSLFKSNLCREALADIKRDHDIRSSANTIVRKCGGLPLAIEVIGSAVAELTSRREWKKEASRIPSLNPQMEKALFGPLKYSYDRLKPNESRTCFLYCALLPESGSIKINQLTDYWVGEGLVRDTTHGEDTIHVLTSAHLLKKGDESDVKMHDIIRQLALWLTSCHKKDEGEEGSSRFLVEAGRGLKEVPRDWDWKAATRISLMSNDIVSLTQPQDGHCTDLSTLFLQNNPNLKEVPHGFFRAMPLLTVLDLSHTAIEEFPIDAGTLTGLRYLNLCHTRITGLPKGLASLKQLSHLDISETSALEVIPDGTISVLTKLRVLNIYRSLYEIRGKEDLNLERLTCLEFLGITVHSEEVLDKLQTEHLLARSTCSLSLNCQGMKSINVSVFEHMARLKSLYLHDCSELKHLNLDVGDEIQALNLAELALVSLPNFEGIPKGSRPHHYHHLHNLCDLTIDRCHRLQNVTWVLGLESLEKLAISHCEEMEHVVEEGNGTIENAEEITKGGEGGVGGGDEIQVVDESVGQNGTHHGASMQSGNVEAFWNLKSIILEDLKNLQSICHPRTFPKLKIQIVENCPNLKNLPWIQD